MTTWKIFDARDYKPNMRVSVYAGKIMFGKKAYSRLGFDVSGGVRLARVEDTGILYMGICSKDTEDAFLVKETDNGGYINARNLLDYLNIDYKNKRVYFELSRTASYDKVLKGKAYKITIITNDRKKKK